MMSYAVEVSIKSYIVLFRQNEIVKEYKKIRNSHNIVKLANFVERYCEYKIQASDDFLKYVTRDLCTAKPTLLLFNYLIYYAIISPSKGGRHGYSAERTSVG
ncbi:protein of unknown function [Pseudodesulfovibrio profundus]|uniref:Uncharacterized protein n=2 Tax=Pseudodesulfovibrio profundus TaxID=57320 RepID=A0A2C8FDY5_9BACT|nr:protein of unknown function [Pseudodesulfovibrio profundus]